MFLFQFLEQFHVCNSHKNNFMFANLTKHLNNQTNCRIDLEKLKKIKSVSIDLAVNNTFDSFLAGQGQKLNVSLHVAQPKRCLVQITCKPSFKIRQSKINSRSVAGPMGQMNRRPTV